MGSPDLEHALSMCLACSSAEIKHDAERQTFTCGDCGSVITQEGVDALCAPAPGQALGPLDTL